MAADVLLANASYQVLARISWERAITLLVTGRAELVEAHPDKVIHSQYLSIPLPTIVRLTSYVHIRHAGIRQVPTTYAGIKARDRNTCAYCGGRGGTVDHIIPSSRGGDSEWDNLITACASCNSRKADRTPVEAGMPLLFEPRPLVVGEADQERIWAALTGVA